MSNLTLSAIIKSDYKNRVKRFSQEEVEEGGIVFLGDSLIGFFDLDKYFQNTVINRGIPGDDTKGVLKRLEQIYQIKPTTIIIHIGSNDIVRYQDEEISDLVKRILKIKFQLEDNIKGVKVHLITVSPVLRNSDKTNNTFMQNRTNEIITSINEELLVYTDLVDVGGCLTDESGNLEYEYTTDGLHLNDKGYKIFARHLSQNIKALKLKV